MSTDHLAVKNAEKHVASYIEEFDDLMRRHEVAMD